MESKPYLLFSLHNTKYGIESKLVQEIFLLPEVTPMIETPSDIIGILNLRGSVLPVMHLDLRFGYPLQGCHVSDSVIVVEWQGLRIGMVVNQVHEVVEIDPAAITTNIAYGRDNDSRKAFVTGVAQLAPEMIVLLNPEQLIRYREGIEDLIAETTDFVANTAAIAAEAELADFSLETASPIEPEISDRISNIGASLPGELPPVGSEPALPLRTLGSFYDLYCPNATPETKQIFRQRAEDLRQLLERTDVSQLMPLAVISLNGEYFGLNLDVVREFTDIRVVTPIPCCPQHIIGNMNLRGEILTLIDIRNALNLVGGSVNYTAKVVVVNVGDIVAGLPVDQVLDVTYLSHSEIATLPIAVDRGANNCLLGTAPYAGKKLGVLDLPKILAKPEFTIEEYV
jgi:purine-binding chemotaxis protein CheW